MKPKNLFAKLAKLRYPWPIKILVTAAVIYLVNKSLARDQMAPLIGDIAIVPVVIAFLLGMANFYCQVKRWKVILGAFGVVVGDMAALRTMLWGCLLAFLSPARFGEFFRGFSLPSLNKRGAVFAVLLEKSFAGGAILFSGLICCALSLSRNNPLWWPREAILLGIAAAIVAGVIFLRIRKGAVVRNAFEGMAALSTRQVFVITCHSILAQIFLLGQTAILLFMFGSHDFFNNVITGGQAYAFMMFFPFSIANMGVREYSFKTFLTCNPAVCHAAGLPAIALGASMGILLINIILPALAGLAWWFVDRKQYN